jgi:GxxExxY protein
MTEDQLSKIALDCAMRVHTALGAGLLESAYEECLFYELSQKCIAVERQKPMPLVYCNVKLDCGYRIDLLLEGKLILELKAVEALNEVHLAQLLTYLKLSGCKLGLLINFNVAHLRNGIRRVVLHL